MSAKSQPATASKTPPAIASALRTLEAESSGLTALAAALQNGLGETFQEAVRVLSSAAGRVIVSGIGKSGHIGRKIAATLASTGTPAFFIHPSEAAHGDLGMVTPKDVLLAISWSGETIELKTLVTYSRRFGVPLISITSRASSALGQASDIVIELPRASEACPHGLAPTTSTTMQLVIGDCLAVALLEARGFTATDFKVFHPGGSLGAQQVVDVDEADRPAGFDDEQRRDPRFVEDVERGRGKRARFDRLRVGGHDLAGRRRQQTWPHVAAKVAVGDDADELAVAIDNAETAEGPLRHRDEGARHGLIDAGKRQPVV
ncbi:MAG: SIS domain-containing protein, partial [Hyphomicrobium sp.]|nr:SIS domain-containing protein [Hyphomicrobium sp.]